MYVGVLPAYMLHLHAWCPWGSAESVRSPGVEWATPSCWEPSHSLWRAASTFHLEPLFTPVSEFLSIIVLIFLYWCLNIVFCQPCSLVLIFLLVKLFHFIFLSLSLRPDLTIYPWLSSNSASAFKLKELCLPLPPSVKGMLYCAWLALWSVLPSKLLNSL